MGQLGRGVSPPTVARVSNTSRTVQPKAAQAARQGVADYTSNGFRATSPLMSCYQRAC